MTTVAYNHKDKQIAVDSRLTCGDLITSDECDKFIVDGDDIHFLSGDSCDTYVLIESIKGVEISGDVKAASISIINGEAFYITHSDKLRKTKLTYDFTIGRGDEFALSAMSLGLNAKQAVEHSAKHTTCTGGKIHLYDIEKAKFI